MATEDHSGKVTLYRVPRRYLVALLTSIAMVLVHLFDLTERLGGDADIALIVDRVLEGVVVLATYMGWAGLASWLRDPKKDAVE